MTIRELAKYLDVEYDDNDPSGDILVDSRLLQRIKFLLSEFNESHLVIDDDEPIQVLAEIEESKIEYVPPQFSFVRKWRDETGDESNVIPMNVIIHNPIWIKKCEMERRRKKLLEKQRAMEMDLDDVLSREGA
jgi:hypothetical protein